MDAHPATTPFGRRPLTLAQVAGQAVAKSRKPEQAVHKWAVFRDICTARRRIGVSERALAVLDALLSFHPETALTGAGLVVFPSNHQLSLRAHGMAPATLRRHLAVLVEAGLIVRRDSPNGKRYARKDGQGDITVAFGFDLGPLVVRASQFAAWAEEVRREAAALKRLRERITLARRDIAKMIAMAVEEGIAPPPGGTAGDAGWAQLNDMFRSLLARIPRSATRFDLAPVAEELALMAGELTMMLEAHANSGKISANESQNERHKQNSNPQPSFDSEPRSQKRGGDGAPFPSMQQTVEAVAAQPVYGGSTEGAEAAMPTMTTRPAIPDAEVRSDRLPQVRPPTGSFPLGLVREACPDLDDYAPGGIGNWRDCLETVAVVRPVLGISPSAWDAAREVMGDIPAAIVIACILQRADAIASPGGYLRDLTAKAASGSFSVGPMLMALVAARKRQSRQSA